MIATKVWGFMEPSDVNGGGLSRHHILAAVEGSLGRLQTNYVDLYQVHRRCGGGGGGGGDVSALFADALLG